MIRVIKGKELAAERQIIVYNCGEIDLRPFMFEVFGEGQFD